MKIIDYQPSIEVLSWFKTAGIPMAQLLNLRKVPSFDMERKGAVSRATSFQMEAFRVVHPMPLFDPIFNQSVADLMNSHAAELLAEGKPIRLTWSGGIDSTAALMALKAAGATAQQVEVIYTDSSIAEYPALMPFISQNFAMTKVDRVMPDVSGNTLWVTGEGGNQIFFPIGEQKFQIMQTKFGTSANALPWREFFFQTHPAWEDSGLPGAWNARLITDEAKTVAEELMAACPFPVMNTEQAQWWRIFCLNWQSLALRQGARLSRTDYLAFELNNRPFFMSELWQQWSMKNMSDKEPYTSYLMIKKPLKDYIHAVYPDQDYYDTKAAFGSLRGEAIGRPYVRFEDGSSPLTEAEFVAGVAA